MDEDFFDADDFDGANDDFVDPLADDGVLTIKNDEPTKEVFLEIC